MEEIIFLFGCGRGRHSLSFAEQCVVHTLFEPPPLGGPDVRIFVVAVVFDLVRVAAEGGDAA